MSAADIPNEEVVSLPSVGRRFALAVGCNNSSCVPRNWANLESAEKDARDVAYHLEQPTSGFKPVRQPIVGKDATIPNIRQAIHEFVEGKTEDDLLLFYFSGHAQPIKNNVFFVTYDFNKEKAETDPTWCISMHWLWDMLYQAKGAGSVLIILDCCYAGNMVRAGEDFLQIDLRARFDAWETGTNGEVQPNQSRLILAATGYNMQAEEINGHGQMTRQLIRALAGDEEIMNQKGEVDVYSLHQFLLDHMPKDHISPLSGEIARKYVLAYHPKLSAHHHKNEEKSIIQQLHENILKLRADISNQAKANEKARPQFLDKMLCESALFEHLEHTRVADFLSKTLVLQEEKFLPGLPEQEQLERLGLLWNGHPTYGTLLCFGEDPSQWVTSATTRCIDSSNTNASDSWQDNKKYGKGLLRQFEESCDFLVKRLDSSRIIRKEGSTDRLEIPYGVLREALANALVHREYEDRADCIMIELYRDRVEISSPGDLPQNMSLENLLEGHGSHPRNPQIAEIFHLYGVVEERGKGIERMRRFMMEAELPEPQFEVSQDKRFKVTLYRPTMSIIYEASNEGQQGNFYGAVSNQKHVYYNAPVVEPYVRKTLLERVHKAWIKGFLEPSLKGATFIPLGLYERPGLIKDPWKDIRQEAERSEGPLPEGTSIADVYDESEGALLILGEPGSGKTTLLLQLAHTLLERASRDQTHPMPVVFNLSTWAEKHQPLSEWLVAELSARYQIPQKMGKLWVEAGQVLPLLDGLDEVAADYRGTCVNAINAYQQQQVQVPLVVGSRLAEYSALVTKIVTRRAVIVQPMALPQIHEYLEKAEGQFEALQELLRDDPGFREFARNPLMLSILKQTYQGKAVQLARSDSIEEKRRQIFADYVERMLQRRGRIIHYSPEQTKYWLIWLAKQMKQRNQTVFYIENLQIDWLEKSWPVEISTSLAFGLLTFPVALIIFGLEYMVYGLAFAVVNGILAALLTTIITFFFVWLIETGFRVENLFPRVKRPVHTAEEKSAKRTKLAAFLAPLFWERASFALLGGLLSGLLIEFLVGPLYALINGLFLSTFLIVLGKCERKIHPAEKLVWTWNSLQKHAVGSLLIGVGMGVFGGVFDAAPYFPQLSVFLTTLSFWLSLGFALGIIIMLMRGFSSSELDKRQKDIKPNQGIRNSLSNSLRLGLSSGVLVGGVIFFFYSFVIHAVFRVGYLLQLPQNADIAYGVGDAVAVAYLFWLINGGFAYVQHLMLRVTLWQAKCIPWRYPHFLDYAYDRILLSKVGGGYVFIHKLLLEYFADLDIEAGSKEHSGESKREKPEAETMLSASEKNSDAEDEGRKEPTAPLILIPVLSDVPRLLPCGHEQRDPNKRFCSICGRPVLPESLKE